MKFILWTERAGTLITTNRCFSENLEKARLERIKAVAKNHAVSEPSLTYELLVNRKMEIAGRPDRRLPSLSPAEAVTGGGSSASLRSPDSSDLVGVDVYGGSNGAHHNAKGSDRNDGDFVDIDDLRQCEGFSDGATLNCSTGGKRQCKLTLEYSSYLQWLTDYEQIAQLSYQKAALDHQNSTLTSIVLA